MKKSNNIFVKNLTNKNPTKDISDEDLKFKLFLSTSKKKRSIKINSKVKFTQSTLPVIAGPNGIESKELLFEVAKFFKKLKINLFRVHAFKPLTFPYRSNQYHDVGIDGLSWVNELKKYYNFTYVSEITEIQYLDKLASTVDILQIGSRNMQNFELLRECARSKKTLILKRHFGSSLRDFLGAAEHILTEGNENLILCERGVSTPHTHKDTSRFMLDIQGIVALKEISNLPVISDPSHASFWAPWVPNLAYASVASGCDGLIIETHPRPSKSKVDPLQPLDFKTFDMTLRTIKKISKIFNKKII